MVLANIGTVDLRIEEVESVGESNRWNLWIFDVDADVREEDILILTDLQLALAVGKTAEYTKLKGTFHHYEVLTDEHAKGVTELLALVP